MKWLWLVGLCLVVCRVYGVEVAGGLGREGFSYQSSVFEETPRYTVYRMTYDSPRPWSLEEGRQGVAYYYKPKNMTPASAPRPAVLCLHISGGDGSLTRMICSKLAADGIPAMMCIMPLFGERSIDSAKLSPEKNAVAPRLYAEALLQTPGDILRAYDILRAQPGVNPDKMNIMGTSLGALFAATVTGMEPDIKKAAFMLGGGDLLEIVALPTPETAQLRRLLDSPDPAQKAELLAALAEIEPLKRADAIRARGENGNILMYVAANDEVIPPSASRKLAERAGVKPENYRVIADAGHYSAIGAFPDMLDALSEFFRDETVTKVKEPGKPAMDRILVSRMLVSLGEFFDLNTLDGQTQTIDLAMTFSEDGKNIGGGSLLWRKGPEDYFFWKLHFSEGKLERYSMMMGNGEYFWVSGEASSVYAGTVNPAELNVQSRINPRLVQYRNLASGMLKMASLNPDLLKKWAEITVQNHVVVIRIPRENATLRITPDATGKRPAKIDGEYDRIKFNIDFKEWSERPGKEMNDFMPPADSVIVDVEHQYLERMIAAVIQFATKGMK